MIMYFCCSSVEKQGPVYLSSLLKKHIADTCRKTRAAMCFCTFSAKENHYEFVLRNPHLREPQGSLKARTPTSPGPVLTAMVAVICLI